MRSRGVHRSSMLRCEVSILDAVFDHRLEDGKAHIGREIFDGYVRAASIVAPIAGSEVESTLKTGEGNEKVV